MQQLGTGLIPLAGQEALNEAARNRLSVSVTYSVDRTLIARPHLLVRDRSGATFVVAWCSASNEESEGWRFLEVGSLPDVMVMAAAFEVRAMSEALRVLPSDRVFCILAAAASE